MIQQQMQFHFTAPFPEFCPVEQRQTQIDGAGIQTRQLVLEPKRLFPSRLRYRRLALLQQLPKHGLVQLPTVVARWRTPAWISLALREPLNASVFPRNWPIRRRSHAACALVQVGK